MLLYGAGGYAKIIISCILANSEKIEAIFDDDLSKNRVSGITVAGHYDPMLHAMQKIIIAIGDNRIRQIITQKINHPFATLRHPSAMIDASVAIGEGSVIVHGGVIQANSIIGKHVIVNTGAQVDHDCSIGDFVHLAPRSVLCGNVRIGGHTFFGAGSIAVPNITIGSNCQIAAGSVITHSIPDGSIVRGNPGRLISTRS